MAGETIPGSITPKWIPESWDTVKKRVTNQNTLDKKNGYTPKESFPLNSSGESIYEDGGTYQYNKQYTDPQTGAKCVVQYNYNDNDKDGTVDSVWGATPYPRGEKSSEFAKKLREEGKVLSPGLKYNDTDNNGTFDQIVMSKENEQGIGSKHYTYTADDKNPNTFKRTTWNKVKDFFKNI